MRANLGHTVACVCVHVCVHMCVQVCTPMRANVDAKQRLTMVSYSSAFYIFFLRKGLSLNLELFQLC